MEAGLGGGGGYIHPDTVIPMTRRLFYALDMQRGGETFFFPNLFNPKWPDFEPLLVQTG